MHRAPLACIDWERAAGGLVAQDCRDFFYPLTELTPPPVQTALHVTAINWTNDDVQTLDQLYANGLSLTLDGAPVAGIDPARFIVTLEYPLSLNQYQDRLEISAARARATGLLRTEQILDGDPVTGNTIAWKLPENVYYYLQQALASLTDFADDDCYVRTRVSLRGGMIWGTGWSRPIWTASASASRRPEPTARRHGPT